jgi:hypothetical protein
MVPSWGGPERPRDEEPKMSARDTLRDALHAYAWLGDEARQKAEVACIMGHPDVMIDHGDAERVARTIAANDWAVSALYETHDFNACPHRPTPAGA